MSFKDFVKSLLLKSRMISSAAKLATPGVAILRYHSVQEDPEHFSNTIGTGIIHSKAVFKEQMELIAQRFNPVTLNDILLFINGEKNIRRKGVAVTFDDGFLDNYETAAPILNHYGITAAFFITVNSVETRKPPWFYRLRKAFFTTRSKDWLDSGEGQVWKLDNQEEKDAAFIFACEKCARLVGDSQEVTVKRIEDMLEVDISKKADNIMMTWEQIRQLRKVGHIIGSHTLTHPNLAYLEETDLRRELILSKEMIEDKLNTPIIHFSYPSPILQPHWNKNTLEITKQAGYQTAVTCTAGLVRISTNPLSLNRIWVPGDRNEFLWNLESTFLGLQM